MLWGVDCTPNRLSFRLLPGLPEGAGERTTRCIPYTTHPQHHVGPTPCPDPEDASCRAGKVQGPSHITPWPRLPRAFCLQRKPLESQLEKCLQNSWDLTVQVPSGLSRRLRSHKLNSHPKVLVAICISNGSMRVVCVLLRERQGDELPGGRVLSSG